MAFYRTYRPKVLEEIDNATVRTTLELLLTKAKNQLPHAYLLTGPKGTGKTTTARVIAKLFNCEKPAKSGLPGRLAGAPCGSCDQCKEIAEGRHLDVMEIDAASHTGVDNIRDLRDAIALAPAQAKWKIFIIDEVHMLSTGAFNALLKTLEEPPLHAIFILATTDPQKIPATVVSRCQLIPFGKAQNTDLIHALKRIAREEKIPIDESALSLICANADGSFRDAVKMLEQLSFHKAKVTEEIVRTTLSLSGSKRRDDFLTHTLDRDARPALGDIAVLVQEGVDVKTFIIECLSELERRLVSKVKDNKGEASTVALRDLIERLSQAYGELRTSPIPQLPLELAVVEYCQEQQHSSTSALDSSSVIPSKAGIQSLGAQNAGSPIGVGDDSQSAALLTLEKLTEHWHDVISEMKPFNHSVAGVMHSTRPKAINNGIVTIEAFYPFHQDRLSEGKTRDAIAAVLKKLFGEKVKVDVVLGKK